MDRNLIRTFPLLVPLLVGGCGNNNAATDAGAADLRAPGPPPAPLLGDQIDRMGRPAINTALTDPFDIIPNMTADMVKDAYNAAGDPNQWAAMFRATIAVNLAVLDGADTVCGNQILAGPTATAGRYDMLAGILADDRLVLDASQTACNLYLGVEAKAAQLFPVTDCGGRTPTENVIDESYSLLIAGLDGVDTMTRRFKITNGITSDADNAPTATFPFLGAPNL